MKLYPGFKKEFDSETKRQLIQITYGDAFCYPLYYFIPSITDDQKYIVYHRYEKDDVQLYATDLQTGEVKKLTHANDDNPSWKIWCSPVKSGVLDHRSVLNTITNDVIYIENNHVHTVNINSLKDEILFSLADDRRATGQNCVTPDGNWFVYIHTDLAQHNRISDFNNWDEYISNRHFAKQAVLAGYNLKTGEHRDILILDGYFHHVFPYDNSNFILNHPPNESGMMLTSLEGSWYTHLRTQQRDGRKICHAGATSRGIVYEAASSHTDNIAGIYNPFNHRFFEFNLPENFGYTHTGIDPEGLLFYYENINYEIPSREILNHDMYYLKSVLDNHCSFEKIIGHRNTYGVLSQKSHFHPRMTADRTHIVFTGGCDQSKTNHIYFADIEDLDKTEGIVYP
ncbi:MAG: hypothetical protein JXQ23_09925 [Clostridia bacterium]|nr:hypothetical protein [Clostridia bacterium]